MITVMTPTFNRAYILEKAYHSLLAQTSADFEWIVVDDGSVDGTEELVKHWAAECTRFPIIYLRQPNGGKHRAVNRAVKAAHCPWFLILDSDDQLMPDAVAQIHRWIAEVDGSKALAGVAGLRESAAGAIGGALNADYIDATNLERRKYGLTGDKAEVYRTEILKRYPFPAFEGENFIRESSVWDRIARDGFKLRWYNTPIYRCEYIADGLTKNTSFETYAKNFNGYTYCAKLFLETHSGIYALHKCGEYYEVAQHKGIGVRDAACKLGVGRYTVLAGICVFRAKQCLKHLRHLLRSKQ